MLHSSGTDMSADKVFFPRYGSDLSISAPVGHNLKAFPPCMSADSEQICVSGS